MEGLLYATFSLRAPDAQSVYVAGSFNEWSLNESGRMQREGDRWTLRLPLDQGTYEYQFVVDGRWMADPANARRVNNGFGDMNSVLELTANG